MTNRNRILSQLGQPAPTPGNVINRRVVKRRGGATVVRTRHASRRVATADVPVDDTLVLLQARTAMPIAVAAALRALVPAETFVEIGPTISETARAVSPWFRELITLERAAGGRPAACDMLLGNGLTTCLPQSPETLRAVLADLRGPALFWLTEPLPAAGEIILAIYAASQRHVVLAANTPAALRTLVPPTVLAFHYQNTLVMLPALARTLAWFNTFAASVSLTVL